MKRTLALVATASLVTGCNASTPPPAERVGETHPPPAVTSEPAAPVGRACGVEQNNHGRGYDASARDCLWNAFSSGDPATLTIVLTTIEGDPIAFTIVVLGDGSIDVTRDSQDRFGSKGVTKARCTSLVREPVEGTDRSRFVAKGCSGDSAEITVP